MGKRGIGSWPSTALLAGPRALRHDLWTIAADPLPRFGGPLWLTWLPHVLIITLAFAVLDGNAAELIGAYRLGGLGWPLAVIESAALVLAVFRPALAWWISTGAMLAAARAAESVVNMSAAYPWTAWGIMLQAGVLFLLALRVRLRATITALVISVLVGLVCTNFLSQPHRINADVAMVALLLSAVIGAAMRVSQVARADVVGQQVLTARERAQRELLEERSRIARELHDVVAHHMSVISIQAQVASHLVADPPQELKDNLAGIRNNAVEALAELRRVLGVLRSANPDPERHAPQPTLDQLDDLLANVRNAGVAVTAEVSGDRRSLSPGTELSAFRIVQEALSNAMRHAPGSSVAVQIGYLPTNLTIQVTNSATSHAASASPGAGHGLLGIRERTAMLGGELVAGATPAGGYEVAASLPLRGDA